MVTDAGTAIFWLLLVRLTVVAEGTAYPVRTTQVVVPPEGNVAGLHVRLERLPTVGCRVTLDD